MVICVLKFKVVESDLMRVQEGISFLLASVRYKTGCISSEVTYNNEDSTTVLIYEEWKTMAQVRKHLLSNTFNRILEIMDMSIDIPEVIITESDKVMNLHWVEDYILEDRNELVKNHKAI